MSFAWPQAFWFLLLPAAVLAIELFARHRVAADDHPKILRAEAGAGGLSLAARTRSPSRVRPWLCVGLMLTIVALARPQWGHIEEPVFDQAREILIAIDLSRSMLSQDVKPSRLDRAKLLTQSLLEKLAGERVGLVTFSGTAFLQSPLSSDYEILREFLPSLNPDFLPEGGTNYRALIDTSLSAFGSTAAADRFLIILSDGEATDDDWKSSVPNLEKKGIRVIGLGVGTTAGAMIPDNNGGFVKDDRGAVVLSRLESTTLQDLAQATHGTYHDASTWIDLASLLNSTVEAAKKGKFTEKNNVRLVERFQWPLAFGLWCLFVSFCYEFPVRPRPRDLRLNSKSAVPSAPPLVGPAAKAALVVLVGGLSFAALRLHAADAPAPPASAALSKIVARLSAQAPGTQSARDWAELGHETVTWGQHLQSDSRPVPERPVHDALSAVDLGSKMDPKTADWDQLRRELNELLKEPEKQQPQKQDQSHQQNQSQQQKQDQNQQQNQQQQQQSQQDQQQQKQQQSTPSQPKDQDQQQNSSSQPQNSNQQNDSSSQTKPQGKKEGQSAFGDMQKRPQPPPDPREMQKVGGAPEKVQRDQQAGDPQLTVPLQKLEQLRSQDSPAQLFQLMDPEKSNQPNKKSGKNW